MNSLRALGVPGGSTIPRCNCGRKGESQELTAVVASGVRTIPLFSRTRGFGLISEEKGKTKAESP